MPMTKTRKLSSGCDFICNVACVMICSNAIFSSGCGACGRCWKALDFCCLRKCCFKFSDSLTQPAPGATTFNGHDLKYYTDPKYTQWPFFGTEEAAKILPPPRSLTHAGEEVTDVISLKPKE